MAPGLCHISIGHHSLAWCPAHSRCSTNICWINKLNSYPWEVTGEKEGGRLAFHCIPFDLPWMSISFKNKMSTMKYNKHTPLWWRYIKTRWQLHHILRDASYMYGHNSQPPGALRRMTVSARNSPKAVTLGWQEGFLFTPQAQSGKHPLSPLHKPLSQDE